MEPLQVRSSNNISTMKRGAIDEAEKFLRDYENARVPRIQYDKIPQLMKSGEVCAKECYYSIGTYDIPLPRGNIIFDLYVENFDFVELLCNYVPISIVSRKTSLQFFGGRPHPALLFGFIAPANTFLRVHASTPFVISYKYTPAPRIPRVKFLQIFPSNEFRDRMVEYTNLLPKLKSHIFKESNELCHNILLYDNSCCNLMYV